MGAYTKNEKQENKISCSVPSLFKCFPSISHLLSRLTHPDRDQGWDCHQPRTREELGCYIKHKEQICKGKRRPGPIPIATMSPCCIRTTESDRPSEAPLSSAAVSCVIERTEGVLHSPLRNLKATCWRRVVMIEEPADKSSLRLYKGMIEDKEEENRFSIGFRGRWEWLVWH